MIIMKRILTAIIMLALGVGLIFIGVYVKNHTSIPKEFTGQTKALVTDVAPSDSAGTGGAGSNNYKADISYVVNNTQYAALIESDNSMAKGKEIKIAYDTRDPNIYVVTGKNNKTAYTLMGIGVVLLICSGLVLSGKFIFRKRKVR